MDIVSYLLGKKSSGGGGGTNVPDWSQIGYSDVPQSLINEFNYSKSIYDNWDSSVTNLTDKFNAAENLVYMPLVDTSNATLTRNMFAYCSNLTTIPLLNISNSIDMYGMFRYCYKITKIPLFDTSNAKSMQNMFSSCTKLTEVPILNTSSLTGSNSYMNVFSGCPNLSDTSLDNILQMCINATLVGGAKTLARMGFTSTNYPTNRIEALPHYQDFVNAGWSIGY